MPQLCFACFLQGVAEATAAATTVVASSNDPSTSAMASQGAEGGPSSDQVGLLKDTVSNITKQTSNITNITKQRVKLNIKVLGVQLAGNQQDPTGVQAMPEKQTSREQFTAPEMSIVSKLMTKVIIN